jgi:hypothetical protein
MNKYVLKALARSMYKIGFRSNRKAKRALVSYVPTLPFWNNRYFLSCHNSHLKSYLICNTLNRYGYSVDLRRYDDLNVPTDRQYDLFIGHTKTFIEIKNKIKLSGKSILFVTGSSPEFGNSAQHKRAEDLFRRKMIQIAVHQENIVAPAKDLHAAADRVLMLGNEFVKSTWYPEFFEKYTLINNVTAQEFRPLSENGVEFLFLSSTGQVHRGLDVLLDVFAHRSEHLHICSSVLNEVEFVKAYHSELFRKVNIHTHGHLDLASQKFREIIKRCGFVILPSCSEGQSSSVINAVNFGLIPVVTENVGLPMLKENGFSINEISTGGVEQVLNQIRDSSNCDLMNKKRRLKNYSRFFQVKCFVESIEHFLLNNNLL